MAFVYKFPLSVHSSGRYLVDALGQPYFIWGDAAFSLIVTPSFSDAKVYLDDRLSRGVNTVLVDLLGEFGANPNAPNTNAGVAPFTTVNDVSTPNDTYFNYAQSVVTEAANRNMLVLLTSAWHGFGGADWYNNALVPSGVTKCGTYGNYVGGKFKNFTNIIWVHAGDTDPGNQAITLAIRDNIASNAPTHLHTVECNEGDSGMDIWSGTTLLQAPVGLNSVYDWQLHSHFIIAKSISAWQLLPRKPHFCIESQYENENSTSNQLLRQQMYESVLGGGSGHVFGSDPIWGFFTNSTQGYTGTPQFWKDRLNSTGAQHLAVWGNFISSKEWWKLQPDTGNTFLTSGLGADPTRASAALAWDNSFGLIYVPTSRSITFARSVLRQSMIANWIDPTNGRATPLSGSPDRKSVV